MAGIHDVAKLAGVSASTVSNVINGRTKKMRAETRQRVLDAIEALKFTPNSAARQLKSGHNDTIGLIKPDVNIVGMGWVASAGALIYISVPQERRFCTPNTRFLLHQPSGGAGGAASDIEIQAREIIKMRERLNLLFAAATGQPLERIEKDTDRDYWMGADEAIKYGLVGRVISSIADLER